MIQIRVLVRRLLCLSRAGKHGKPDATFELGSAATADRAAL